MRMLLAALLAIGFSTAHAQVVTPGPSAPNLHPGFVANNWYQPFVYTPVAAAGAAPGAGKIVCTYGDILYPVTLNSLGADATTNDAGKRFQLAIYSTGFLGASGNAACQHGGYYPGRDRGL